MFKQSSGPSQGSTRRHQQGVALYVALIVLVVMTVLGIALLGNNNLQSRMAYNTAEAQFAFVSAETALTAGEDWVAKQSKRPITSCTTNCAADIGIWKRFGEASPPVNAAAYSSSTWWEANGRPYGNSYVEGVAVAAIAGQSINKTHAVPRYVVEDLGADPAGSLVVGQGLSYRIYYFQVTGRGFGAQSDSQTLTQSVFAKGF